MDQLDNQNEPLSDLDFNGRYISASTAAQSTSWTATVDGQQLRFDDARDISPSLQSGSSPFSLPADPSQVLPDWPFSAMPPPPPPPHPALAPDQPLPFAPASESSMAFPTNYSVSLNPSSVDLLPVSQPGFETSLIDSSYLSLSAPVGMMPLGWPDFPTDLLSFPHVHSLPDVYSDAMPELGSPTGSYLEERSLPSSSSDNGWTFIDHRQSLDSTLDPGIFIDPTQTLHNRTLSDSYSEIDPNSIYADQGHPRSSPISDQTDPEFGAQLVRRVSSDIDSHGSISPTSAVSPVAIVRPVPVSIKKSSSPTNSASSHRSTSSQHSTSSQSPPTRSSPTTKKQSRRSPIAAKADTKVRKAQNNAKSEAEKRIGKRKGPLRPDQRKQASEIRKLRACLRCKFLKKTCDKGEPCGGCQPSHARLWQVPCTRIDIKDIGYFIKDWTADFQPTIPGFSFGNIRGFSNVERTLFITHGYGQVLPISAREVFVGSNARFSMDWAETHHGPVPLHYTLETARLSVGADGISPVLLSDYLDRHIDGKGTFERFISDYFSGTPFVSELLKTSFRYYSRTKLPVIRKALKLILAYNLTSNITMVEGIGEMENFAGKVRDRMSVFNGKTMAPIMINFQIKAVMGNMWRELQKEILEELSALYSSVYSGDKLKNWPTIFILASVLLAVWEEMQFDCHYRVQVRSPNYHLLDDH